MALEEEFIRRIQAEIEKSGLPLELSVVEELRRRRQILVHEGVRYTKGEHQLREIDIIATLVPPLRGPEEEDVAALDLIIECKTSRKRPWVFFQMAYDPLSVMGLVNRACHFSELSFREPYKLLAGCFNSALRRHHYNANRKYVLDETRPGAC